MPLKMWRLHCLCTPGVVSIGSPTCGKCGQPGEYDGWHLGTYEEISAYVKRTGLRPTPPSRELADDLFKDRFEPCPTCQGRGVLDVEEGKTWEECPNCRGACQAFKGAEREFQEIRTRILRKFPDAALASSRSDDVTARERAAAVQEDDKRIRAAVRERFDPEAHIRCVFYTLAVRNEALKKKWRNGLLDYWGKYNNVHNDEITASCFMGPYWGEQRAALFANGLEERKDFIVFDASDVILAKDFEPFHFRVAWLGGYVHDAGVMIYLRH